MTKWPAVDLGKIFSFILTQKEFDSTYVGKYKDQKAFSHWKSNFFGPIYFSQNKDDKCILKSTITPSQRVCQDPHQAWVAVRNNGTIVCGWCTCIAGTSATCNHIIALLYKVNFAVQSGYTDPACTSVPSGWNHSTRKDVQPGKVIEMDIRKDKASRNGNEARGIINDAWRVLDHRKEGQREISESKKTRFLNGLAQTRPTAQILKSMEYRLHRQPRHKLYMTECAENFSSSFNREEQEKINGFLATLPLSDEEVTFIEKETRGQSSSTALKEHKKGDRNCKLTKSGLRVMKGKPYIRASPDGLMSCSCCGQTIVDIKCPYCIRDLSVCESWEKTDFLVLRTTPSNSKKSASIIIK